MLVEFSVGNYLSFKEKTRFSMIGVNAFKELDGTNAFTVKKGFKLLKSAAIYGSNASGKSNFLAAILTMKRLATYPLQDTLSPGLESYLNRVVGSKFLLHTLNASNPVFFEVVFIGKEGSWYRYGFEINTDGVVREWLLRRGYREVLLFRRTAQTIEINRSSFKEGVGLEERTRKDVLFLTVVSSFNGKVSGEVIKLFHGIKVIGATTDKDYRRYTASLTLRGPYFLRWAHAFVQFLGITRLSMVAVETSNKGDFDRSFTEAEAMDEAQLESTQFKIQTWRRRYDGHNLVVDEVPFAFPSMESGGSQRLILLLGPLYDTLKRGDVLAIDELDARLHPNVTTRLIEYFHKANKTNAQLIFTTHGISMLNKNLMRRDQIWFVEKDQFGSSSLYSLGDFKSSKVRKESSFYKNYLTGKYGAAPYFNHNDADLNALLYGQD